MLFPAHFPVYICWDMNACPPPKDEDPYLVLRTIVSAVRKQNLYGAEEIRAYYTKGTLETAVLGEYADAGCITSAAENEFAKVNTMLVDMLLWTLNSRKPANFVVITRIAQDTEYLIRGLLAVEERWNNVFLFLPDTSVPTSVTVIKSFTRRNGAVFLRLIDSAPDNNEIKVCCCKLLEKIMKADEESESEEEEDEVAEEEEKVEETGCESLGTLWMPTVFSIKSDSKDKLQHTGVFWDVEDYSLPADLSLATFYRNIKHYFEGKGSDGDVFIWAYVPDHLMDGYKILAAEFDAHRFVFEPKVPQDKYARLNKMTLDLLLWTIDNPLERLAPILLVISKDMEAKATSLCFSLGCLGARGWPVFFTLPGAGDVAPKEARNVTVLPWEVLSYPNKRRRA